MYGLEVYTPSYDFIIYIWMEMYFFLKKLNFNFIYIFFKMISEWILEEKIYNEFKYFE